MSKLKNMTTTAAATPLQTASDQTAESAVHLVTQQETRKRGRPKRTKPYVLPPLPNKGCPLTTREQSEQRQTRSTLQNNAASLRYRRKQEDKHLQREKSMHELFLKKAQLHAKEAKLKQGIQSLNKHIWQQASQGCGECLQASLLIQASPFPSYHPMVKIEASCMEEVNDCVLPMVKIEAPCLEEVNECALPGCIDPPEPTQPLPP